MGYADVGADIYVALGLVAFYAAGASPIAFAIASVTYICTGLAYAELASVYPYAGGAQVYAMKAFNDSVGFVAGWAVMLDYTIDIALFSLATSGYLSFFLPWLKTGAFVFAIGSLPIAINYLGLTAFLLVLPLLALNYLGIRESSLMNEVLVAFSIVVKVTIMVFGAILAFNLIRFMEQITIVGADAVLPNIQYIFGNMDVRNQNFIYGVTLAMTSFIGIESIAQAAEETRRPQKWIPRANKLSILSVLVFALGLSTLSTGMMPWGDLAASQTDPMTALAKSIPVIGSHLAPVVAFTGFALCYVSTNTGVIGVSRVAYSMGRFKLFPEWFYKVHPRFRTPHRTIFCFGLMGALLASVGELYFIADLYNFGALLSYMIVNLSLIVLRNTEPEAYRAWKVPLDIVFKMGKRKLIIPIISVVGAVSCLIIWLLVLAFHPAGRLLGAAWVAVGLVGFAIHRRRLGLSVLSSEVGRSIHPSGYLVNALVLVRVPEDEGAVVKSINQGLDRRYNLALLNIIDPSQLNLSAEDIGDFEHIRKARESALKELSRVTRVLQRKGYNCSARVEVGSYEKVLGYEAELPGNDLIVLIKRRTLRGGVEREHPQSVHAIASRYPGKLLVIRRIQ